MIFNYLLLAALSLTTPLLALAAGGGAPGSDPQGFTPLIGIPGIEANSTFGAYVNALYALAISLAALIAVIKIIIAGAKYMLSDIVSTKSDAKDDIKNSLIGLLIIIGAVVILNTINSDLTNTGITAEPVTLDDTPLPPGVIMESIENGAQAVSCEDSQRWGQLGVPSSVTSCRERCAAVNGLYRRSSFALTEGNCWVPPDRITNALEENEEALITEHCPDGVGNCIVQACDIYGDDGAVNFTSCQQFCDARGGVHFDPRSTNCVIPGETRNSTIGCESVSGDGLSSTNTWDCSAAIDRCEAEGGFNAGGVTSAETINCVVNTVEISPEVRNAVCTGGTGYSCTIIPCGATGLFSACSTWCAQNGNHTYNRTYGVCYTERRL